MVLITRSYLEGLSSELRELSAQVAGLVSELVEPEVWAGPDAERFETKATELVSGRLEQAAALLDSAALVRFAPL